MVVYFIEKANRSRKPAFLPAGSRSVPFLKDLDLLYRSSAVRRGSGIRQLSGNQGFVYRSRILWPSRQIMKLCPFCASGKQSIPDFGGIISPRREETHALKRGCQRLIRMQCCFKKKNVPFLQKTGQPTGSRTIPIKSPLSSFALKSARSPPLSQVFTISFDLPSALVCMPWRSLDKLVVPPEYGLIKASS